MPVIVTSNFYSEKLLSVIREALPLGFTFVALDEPTQENLISKIPQADYLLVGGRIKIDENVLNATLKLKMIQRTGVGLDSINFEAVKNRNIPVYVNPGINARSVAEHTIALIFSVLKNISQIDATLKSGTWKKHELGINNFEIFGKTVGLIGLGNIGLYVAKMLQPFGVKLLYTKRTRLSQEEENELSLIYVSKEELIKQSDIISLHCPLNEHTDKIIDTKEFDLMKTDAILINTSRGKLINQTALIEVLKTKRIKGAGLDVFETEPLSKDSELLQLTNVILSPHISGITRESFLEMMKQAFSNIENFEKGNINLIKNKNLIF